MPTIEMMNLILRDIKLIVKDYMATEFKSQNQTQDLQANGANCFS